MSGVLISRQKLIDSIEKRYIQKKGSVPDNLAEGFVQMEKLIKEQPTAFDLESVMRQLEENKQDLFNAIDKDYQNNKKESVNALKGLFEDYTEEIMIILKSAANVTDGKNGG